MSGLNTCRQHWTLAVHGMVVVAFALLTACGRNSGGMTQPSVIPPPTAAPTPAPTPTPPTFESADAILARCPTPDEVAATDRDLLLSFDTDVTAGRTECPAGESSRDLTLLQAQTYRALTIMRRLTFDASLPWTSDSLYEWMTRSIRGIRFRGDDVANSFCCAPADTINIKATLGPNNSGLAALVFPRDFRAVGTLVVLFVHEARHNNGFPHTCGTNDRTIAEMGAWGVQYHTDRYFGLRSDPLFVSPSARAAFVDDAERVCATRFCEDQCP